MPPIDSANETRKQLGNFWGQAAIDLGVLTPEERAQTLEVQARFLAAHLYRSDNVAPLKTDRGWEQDAPAKELLSAEGWARAKGKYLIDDVKMAEVRGFIQSGQSVPPGSAPSSGDIAVALGFLPQQVKDAVLSAQGAERSLRAAESLLALSRAPVAAPGKEAFTKLVSDRKWQFIGKSDKEPLTLQRAQAVNFLSETLEAAYRQGAEAIAQDEGVRQAQAAAVEAIGRLSAISFARAAEGLPGNAQSNLMLVAEKTVSRTGANLNASEAEINRELDAVKDSLATVKNYLVGKGILTETEWPGAQIDEKFAIARKSPPAQGESVEQPSAPPRPPHGHGGGKGR